MQIFISHSSKDADIAFKICETLERNGNKCFIAPRDIHSRRKYAEELFNGIENSSAMLLLMSESSNTSEQVLREVEHAVSKSKPIYVYKLGEVVLSKSMEYFLMTHQWTSAATDENYTDIMRFVELAKLRRALGEMSFGKVAKKSAASDEAAPYKTPKKYTDLNTSGKTSADDNTEIHTGQNAGKKREFFLYTGIVLYTLLLVTSVFLLLLNAPTPQGFSMICGMRSVPSRISEI